MGDRVVIWRDGDLVVSAYRDDDDLVIYGDHVDPPHISAPEYEYWLRISPADIDTVVAALGGEHDADVLALLLTNASRLITVGEKTWLDRNDIPYTFSNWISSD